MSVHALRCVKPSAQALAISVQLNGANGVKACLLLLLSTAKAMADNFTQSEVTPTPVTPTRPQINWAAACEAIYHNNTKDIQSRGNFTSLYFIFMNFQLS